MPSTPNAPSLIVPLDDAEMNELDQFLCSDATSDEVMMIDCLDGYLTAILAGPTSLSMNQWLSGIWGQNPEDAPHFETMEHAQRIIDLIMRHYNGIIWGLQGGPDAFEPIFNTVQYPDNPDEVLDGEMWAHGFMRGVELCRSDWQPLFDDPNGRQWLRPIVLLGAEEVTPEEEGLVRWPAQREALAKQIPASVVEIYRFWLPYRQAVHDLLVSNIKRKQPKVGRNDPCPCGSGKKFKKCCGASETLH